MSAIPGSLTERERELGAIINAYNEVTEQLRQSHDQLRAEVSRLSRELAAKNAELRRRERLAALGEMAAGVAHEIRNPLGGIQLFASLLAQDLADRPQERQLAGKITACVGVLEGIVSDILDFARPAQPNPTSIDLAALVSETVELALSRPAGADVRVDVADEVRQVELISDPSLLQRALLNLLVNAVEATASHEAGRRGCVRIGVRRGPGGLTTIRVEDDGPGLDPDLINRIFDPFFTTKDNGTGLGLAIVHQITEMLGGSVRAGNRPDGGAVFSLCLPSRPADNDGGQVSVSQHPSTPARWSPSAREVA